MHIILFDIDGTLISTAGAGQSAMDVVSAETGTRAGDSGKLKYAGRTDKSIIRDHLQEFGIAETQENYAAYRDRFLEKLPEHLRLDRAACCRASSTPYSVCGTRRSSWVC